MLCNKTRTIIIDLQDMDDPKDILIMSETDAIDHNGYVNGSKFYLASYTSGLRVIDILNIGQNQLKRLGIWYISKRFTRHGVVNSQRLGIRCHDGNKGGCPFFIELEVYPYFQSRNIIISDINLGLFIVRKVPIDGINFLIKT